MIKKILPYISIARPDHWFKNVFMVFGIVLVLFYKPALFPDFATFDLWKRIIIAFISTCLVASSNYVVNEILDAPTDKSHPVKKNRPIPSGQVWLPIAWFEWLAIGACGLAMAWTINLSFFFTALWLWVMGIIYNVPPLRSKELPYVDVLSEAINNPIRLLLGWFVLLGTTIPPISLMIAYWMMGAFFMAAKRWAEYRMIGDRVAAGQYRRSFRWYTLENLMVSMFFYAIHCSLFLGVFIVRYHIELILSMPLIAGFFSYYLRVTFMENSPVQAPEHLYRQKGLMIYLVICLLVFFGLMFTSVPIFYELINLKPQGLQPLWTIGP
ncbi:MAG: UbiA prenyltransferase family protein [Planctomycetia bacterium]|nr:UbiA prenyltransferase family protein [Planctomycetia bacterium]